MTKKQPTWWLFKFKKNCFKWKDMSEISIFEYNNALFAIIKKKRKKQKCQGKSAINSTTSTQKKKFNLHNI